MWTTAQATGRKFSIQFVTMYANETKAAKYLIDAGHLGHVYHVRSYGHRRRGRPYVDGYGSPTFVQKQHSAGGALYDMGVYHISTLLYLIGNPEVQRISGKTYQETDIDERRRSASGYNVEELGLGFVRFAGGLTMDVLEAWAVHMDKFDGSMILGSQGGLRIEPFGYFRSIGDLDMDATAGMDGFDWRLHTVRENGDAYDGPQQHWIAALQGRVPLMPTAACALTTMLISEGIYLSDRLGREVSAEEVLEHSISTSIMV
jgi:predicted dehydrogenase